MRAPHKKTQEEEPFNSSPRPDDHNQPQSSAYVVECHETYGHPEVIRIIDSDEEEDTYQSESAACVAERHLTPTEECTSEGPHQPRSSVYVVERHKANGHPEIIRIIDTDDEEDEGHYRFPHPRYEAAFDDYLDDDDNDTDDESPSIDQHAANLRDNGDEKFWGQNPAVLAQHDSRYNSLSFSEGGESESGEEYNSRPPTPTGQCLPPHEQRLASGHLDAFSVRQHPPGEGQDFVRAHFGKSNFRFPAFRMPSSCQIWEMLKKCMDYGDSSEKAIPSTSGSSSSTKRTRDRIPWDDVVPKRRRWREDTDSE